MTKTSVVLACLCASTPGPGVGFVHAETRAVPVRAFLCDTAVHAIEFADLLADGESEEMAKARVGRTATADVCGLWSGVARIQSESVSLKGGVAYKLTAFRFQEDQKVAWQAETSFAPPTSAWDL